jgi:hypothetical protein
MTMLGAIIIAFGITVSPLALAASPHFIGTPTINKVISGNTANLFTSGKVAGLGSAPTNFFLTSSGGFGKYQCVNPGARPGSNNHTSQRPDHV